MKRGFYAVGLITITLLALLVGSRVETLVYAQDDGGNAPPTVSEAEINAVAQEMRCTQCGEETLATCTTAQCVEWREEIGALLTEGQQPSYIYRYFAEKYPDDFPNLLVIGQFGDQYPVSVNPNDVYNVAEEMYCDVCAGVSLSYCTSGQCQAWREEISDMLADGNTEEEIRVEFAARYGDKISAVPVDDDSRFIAFALPIFLILLAGGAIIFQITRWRRKDTQALQAARRSGTLLSNNRPVPDNVDSVLLQRILAMVDDKN